MIGNTVKTRSGFLNRNPVRVTTSANESPSSVVETAVRTARNAVFHATPQTPPARQPSPQMLSSRKLRIKATPERLPSISTNDPMKMRATGKNTNNPTSAITVPMAEVTNTSPRIAPAAAKPVQSITSRLAATNIAP